MHLSLRHLFALSHAVFALAATVTKRWDPTLPEPPVQPKECQSNRDEFSDYNYVAGGRVRPLINMFGYTFNSYQAQTIYSSSNGDGGGNPLSILSWANYTTPEDPKTSMQIFMNNGICQYWPIEGGTPYMAYDYFTNLIFGLYNSSQPIYFTTTTDDPIYGNLTSWTAPLQNAGGIVNYTVSYDDSDTLRYYIADGYQYCCEEACPGPGQICRNGSPSGYARTTTKVHYYGYIIYQDNYTWPVNMLQQPACPYATSYCGPQPCPTSTPVVSSSSPALEYTQEEYDTLGVTIGLPLGIGLLAALLYIFFSVEAKKPMSRNVEL